MSTYRFFKTFLYLITGSWFWCWRHMRLKEFGYGPRGCGSCMVSHYHEGVIEAAKGMQDKGR